MNVVLDTNFILDVYFFKNETAVRLFHQLEKAGARFYRTSATFDELKHVLDREEFSKGTASQEEILDSWTANSINFESPSPSALKCRDPLDQKFIDLADSVAPSYLISKDKDILRLRRKASKLRMKFRRPDEFTTFCKLSD